jgi:hypothetical protein
MIFLAERWASIPKVVGLIPTVARHIFQACPVWIYTQSNITMHISQIYSPEYITPTQKKSGLFLITRRPKKDFCICRIRLDTLNINEYNR